MRSVLLPLRRAGLRGGVRAVAGADHGRRGETGAGMRRAACLTRPTAPTGCALPPLASALLACVLGVWAALTAGPVPHMQ